MEVNEEKAVSFEMDGETLYFCSAGCKDSFVRKTSEDKLRRTAYDLIIIGGGPAGLTAAIYASTLKIDALLVTKEIGGQAMESTKIENYMGFDTITGPELIDKFQHQLLHSRYIDHLMGEVEKIEPVQGGFDVITSEPSKYFTKTLIIATGVKRRRLDIPHEEELKGKSIFYGSIQKTSIFEGKDAAVVGGGNSALQVVENLNAVANNIYLISDSGLTADPVNIDKVSHFKNLVKYEGYKIVELIIDETLSGIVIRKMAEKERITIPVKGVVVVIGARPDSLLVHHIVKLNDNGEIVINSDCSTSCPGIFAAGDVTNVFGKRISIASGEGSKATLAARQYLLALKKQA